MRFLARLAYRIGKGEMKVFADAQSADLNYIWDFLSDMFPYVLQENVTFHDGKTIGFNEEQ